MSSDCKARRDLRQDRNAVSVGLDFATFVHLRETSSCEMNCFTQSTQSRSGKIAHYLPIVADFVTTALSVRMRRFFRRLISRLTGIEGDYSDSECASGNRPLFAGR